MSTASHPLSGSAPERRRWSTDVLVPELWASLAIATMWIVVAICAVWGPDFVSVSNSGNSTTIPSGIAVAVFASIGTWVVAKHAFGRRSGES